MLLVTSITKDAVACTVQGKITQKGVIEKTSKAGKKMAILTLAVSTNDYLIGQAEYWLKEKSENKKEVKLTRNGNNAKYPLLFVDVIGFEKTAERMLKQYKAGDILCVLGSPGLNEFNGRYTLSVTLGDASKVWTNNPAETATVTSPKKEAADAKPENDIEGLDWDQIDI